MKKILITGATDGIGLETAKMLLALGHEVLLHGRSPEKLERTRQSLASLSTAAPLETYCADLSRLDEVEALGREITARYGALDVLINNAGVFKVKPTRTAEGLDKRFVVNTIAPYRLMTELLPLLSVHSRVVNLSSAAQSPVHLDALAGRVALTDEEAYAQSKLALTMWSFHMAQVMAGTGPSIIAVNPASLLATRMVRDAFGIAGHPLTIGAEIVTRAALGGEFSDASGRYFDNDQQAFASPHPDALDAGKNARLVAALDTLILKSDSVVGAAGRREQRLTDEVAHVEALLRG